jgi:hypothetical protein
MHERAPPDGCRLVWAKRRRAAAGDLAGRGHRRGACPARRRPDPHRAHRAADRRGRSRPEPDRRLRLRLLAPRLVPAGSAAHPPPVVGAARRRGTDPGHAALWAGTLDEQPGAALLDHQRGPCTAQARADVSPYRERHAATGRPAEVGVPAGRRRPGRPRIAVRHAGAAPARRRRLPDLALRPTGVAAGRGDLPPGPHRPGAQEQPERTGTVPGGGTDTAGPSPARSRQRGRLRRRRLGGGHGRRRRRAACTPRSARLRGGGHDLAARPARRGRGYLLRQKPWRLPGWRGRSGRSWACADACGSLGCWQGCWP